MTLLIYGTKRHASQFRLWIDTEVAGHSDVDAGEKARLRRRLMVAKSAIDGDSGSHRLLLRLP